MKALLISDMNKTYGLWTVISGPHGANKWMCRCEGCGVEKIVSGRHLRNGTSTIYRCSDKSNPNYGGRGIEVRFNDKGEFINHLLTLEGCNNSNLMLDRIDVNGHYEPGNLRFVTPSISSLNRRPFTRRWAKKPI